MSERPIGITSLTILSGLSSILLIISGIIVWVMPSTIVDFVKVCATYIKLNMVLDVVGYFETNLAAIAPIAFILGILYIAVAYGLWKGAGWSRMLAIMLLILDVIVGLVTLPSGIIYIIVAGLICWYLLIPDVKAFFGQVAATALPPPTTAQNPFL
jgi:hypothetical protein